MYNRYIPQSDGTFRRNRMQDPAKPQESSRQEQRPPTPPPQPPESCTEAPPPCRQQIYHRPQQSKQDCPRKRDPVGGSITGFLRQLLPKDFDTGDLLVVMLLLLMSADSCEDQNSALLTLALYLFM